MSAWVRAGVRALVGAQVVVVSLTLGAVVTWAVQPAPEVADPDEPRLAEAQIAPPVVAAPVVTTPVATTPVVTAPSDPSTESVGGDPVTPPQDFVTVGSLPARLAGTTLSDGPSEIDRYACAMDRIEGGPEVWYRVDVAGSGLLRATLVEEPRRAVDVDVHLLTDRDPTTCLARGHVAATALVQPGTYWIAVDTYTGPRGRPRPGAFTLVVDLTPSPSAEP